MTPEDKYGVEYCEFLIKLADMLSSEEIAPSPSTQIEDGLINNNF